MCAVSLYGQFADSELGSDLFVEQAGDNHTQNFPLPGAQRVKALPKLCYFRPLLASGAVVGDRSLNRLQQILATERLGQKLHRATSKIRAQNHLKGCALERMPQQ